MLSLFSALTPNDTSIFPSPKSNTCDNEYCAECTPVIPCGLCGQTTCCAGCTPMCKGEGCKRLAICESCIVDESNDIDENVEEDLHFCNSCRETYCSDCLVKDLKNWHRECSHCFTTASELQASKNVSMS